MAAQNMNVTVNAAANNSINKEDKGMMNMTVKALRDMAKAAGVKGYSNMNKADLVAAIQFFTDEERKANEAVVAPVVEESIVEVAPIPVVPVVGTVVTNTINNTNKEEKEMTTEKKLTKEDCDAMMLVIAWIYQSIHDVLGDKRMLFYVATKRTDLGNVKISSNKKLMKVTGDIIARKYGNAENNYDTIQKWYDLMVERGYCHRNGDNIHMSTTEWNKCREIYIRKDMKPFINEYANFINETVKPKKTATAKVVKTEVVATIVVLESAKLSKEAKELLNAAWKNKQIKVEKSTSEDNKFRVTSLNAEGKKLLDSITVQNSDVAPF